jgi:CDP-glucose 4,6-dehydratase
LGLRRRAVEGLVALMTFWSGRRVLVTGHTGFKGAWLSLWLTELGADVSGYALAPSTDPSLFESARIADLICHIEGDVRDLEALALAVRRTRPEVIFHLAAQSLVRRSYLEPVETYATNVMGAAHVLEATRLIGGVRAVVCVTSDKCYENLGLGLPFREDDPMGGHDPYSSSKGCAELVVSAYVRSFFPPARIGEHRVAVASARAGNVIGGGDWSADRLVPDFVRAALKGEQLVLRYPDALRPWQHVLEPLRGYLMLAERLHAGDARATGSWNFGPSDDDAKPVSWVIDELTRRWGSSKGWRLADGPQLHEAPDLRLDCAKARAELGWKPTIALPQALALVSDWHRRVAAGEESRAATLDQIRDYAGAVRALELAP